MIENKIYQKKMQLIENKEDWDNFRKMTQNRVWPEKFSEYFNPGEDFSLPFYVDSTLIRDLNGFRLKYSIFNKKLAKILLHK